MQSSLILKYKIPGITAEDFNVEIKHGI